MNTVGLPLSWLLVAGALAMPTLVHSQEPAPVQRAEPKPAQPAGGSATRAASAQAEAGEPRADTSGAQTGTAPGTPSAPATGKPAGRPARTAAQKGPVAVDRLDLTTTTVTGEHEQPKVMYVVPWKRSDIGNLPGKPMNSLLDEALAPVDRDEFKREVIYYGAVKSDGSGNDAPNKGAQGEK